MDWQPYITGYIVRSVLSGLVILPALGVSALALRKLGAKHDPTRRWVDFTKAALGLWSIAQCPASRATCEHEWRNLSSVDKMLTLSVFKRSQLLILVCWILWTVVYFQRQNDRSYFGLDDASPYIYIVGSLLGTLGQVALLLAFFFLVHALAQLRGGATTDDSRASFVGRKVVFVGSALIALVEVAVFCCYIAFQIMYKILQERRDRYVPGDWDNAIRLSLASEYMSASNNCMLLIAAVGMTIYAFQAQKKARGSPVQKAATLLLVAVSLWLVARIWAFITTVMSLAMFWWGQASAYVGIIDTILAIWTTFAALMLLYILASSNAYGLSRLHYQDEEDEQRVWEERT
ncbi:hypothetical protein GCG54_00013136 [Colletotrichum gloeosporioides]|uniref:Transmembrane protein n=1 Tax=Colletotrichum gloeosporioides TaxID=474922 RepID=A0A8H4FCC7_COLGL|nr:uncharacterized protein GCG54_00013136 [Colletotrichum gloeosporioides]KAF3797613.1 hypothetical protein GCG54_00013136 [Colletotrichum gloeosporioides]